MIGYGRRSTTRNEASNFVHRRLLVCWCEEDIASKRGAESVRARTCALGLTGEYACGHWILRLSIVEMVARSAFECGSGCFPEPTEPPKVCCPISIGTIRSGVV